MLRMLSFRGSGGASQGLSPCGWRKQLTAHPWDRLWSHAGPVALARLPRACLPVCVHSESRIYAKGAVLCSKWWAHSSCWLRLPVPRHRVWGWGDQAGVRVGLPVESTVLQCSSLPSFLMLYTSSCWWVGPCPPARGSWSRNSWSLPLPSPLLIKPCGAVSPGSTFWNCWSLGIQQPEASSP